MTFTPIVPPITQGGTISGNLAVTGGLSAGSSPGGPIPELVGDVGPAGFALQNATPTVLSWTAPNDGKDHLLIVVAALHVTSAETGGQVSVNTTLPDGSGLNSGAFFAAGLGTGTNANSAMRIVQAGSTSTLTQSSALTAGASLLFAQIYGA